MNKALILVLLSVIISTIGQLCTKAAMLRVGPVAFGSLIEIISSAWQIMQQPLVWVALPLYGFSLIIWAAALSHLQLSFAYPLLAVGYLVVPLAAAIFFDESISRLPLLSTTASSWALILTFFASRERVSVDFSSR